MVQTWQVTQRVSFPKILFSGCAPKFSDAIVELRDDLDAMLQRIRSERQIGSLVFGVGGVGMLAKVQSFTAVFAPRTYPGAVTLRRAP